MNHMAWNQVVSGTRLWAKMVPALSEVCRPAGVTFVKPPLAYHTMLLPSALRAAEAAGPTTAARRPRTAPLKNAERLQAILELDRVARHATSPAECDGANHINDLWREPE